MNLKSLPIKTGEIIGDQLCNSIALLCPFSYIHTMRYFGKDGGYFKNRFGTFGLSLMERTLSLLKSSCNQWIRGTLVSASATVLMSILSTAESLQQCYTNHPVVVVGVVCVVVDRC